MLTTLRILFAVAVAVVVSSVIHDALATLLRGFPL